MKKEELIELLKTLKIEEIKSLKIEYYSENYCGPYDDRKIKTITINDKLD